MGTNESRSGFCRIPARNHIHGVHVNFCKLLIYLIFGLSCFWTSLGAPLSSSLHRFEKTVVDNNGTSQPKLLPRVRAAGGTSLNTQLRIILYKMKLLKRCFYTYAALWTKRDGNVCSLRPFFLMWISLKWHPGRIKQRGRLSRSCFLATFKGF